MIHSGRVELQAQETTGLTDLQQETSSSEEGEDGEEEEEEKK